MRLTILVILVAFIVWTVAVLIIAEILNVRDRHEDEEFWSKQWGEIRDHSTYNHEEDEQ